MNYDGSSTGQADEIILVILVPVSIFKDPFIEMKQA